MLQANAYIFCSITAKTKSVKNDQVFVILKIIYNFLLLVSSTNEIRLLLLMLPYVSG